MKLNSPVMAATLSGVKVAVTAMSSAELRENVEAGRIALERQQVSGSVASTSLRDSARLQSVSPSDTAFPSAPLVLILTSGNFDQSPHTLLGSSTVLAVGSRGIADQLASFDVNRGKVHSEHEFRLPVIVFPSNTVGAAERLAQTLSGARGSDKGTPRELALLFLGSCQSASLDDFELTYSHVAARSRKISSLAQLETGLKTTWSRLGGDQSELHRQAEFLAKFWDALSEIRPEFQAKNYLLRSRLRSSSLATSALGIGACLAVGAVLFERFQVWSAKPDGALRRSALVRVTQPRDEPNRPASSEQGNTTIANHLINRLGEAGWRHSMKPSGAGLVFTKDRWRLECDLDGRAIRAADLSDGGGKASIEAAINLFQSADPSIDFFDLGGPWWRLGGCVSGPRDQLIGQYRQAKGREAKTWAGSLAVRSLN